MMGTLHGVGLGPGAPDLLTLRAAHLIAGAEVVAYPSLAGGESLARAIAAPHLSGTAEEVRIDVPMTRDRAPAQAAYDDGAARIAAHLEAGRDVVCLCEGDPLFYGSFMYLLARLRGRFPVAVVPGVTAIAACTAAAATPLVARDETLAVLPATLPDEVLCIRMQAADAVAIMKVGRHAGRVRDLVLREGLGGTYVERASMEAERVLPLAEAPDAAPYFSMILATRGADPWL